MPLASGDFAWLAKLFKEREPEVLALGIQELHPDLLPKFLQDVQQAGRVMVTFNNLQTSLFLPTKQF